MRTLKRLGWVLAGTLVFIIVMALIFGEDEPATQRTPQPSVERAANSVQQQAKPPPRAERPTAAQTASQAAKVEPQQARPSFVLPGNITIEKNPRYDDTSDEALEQAVAEVAHWFRNEHGLTPALASVIRFEPECSDAGFEALGYTRPVVGPQGETTIEVCVRLEEDRDAALLDDEFRWLLAHEFFHVLQGNAAWDIEHRDLVYGIEGQCGRQMIEGSAEYFGQMYAWGKLQDQDQLSELVSTLDWQRHYYYDIGARAFAALVRLHGQQAITFWESDSERCADEFLARFDVTPARWEADWENR